MDEPAEFVAAPDLASGRSWWRRVGVWRLQGECPVRALGVVVVDVDAEHAFEVSAVEGQQPVEALCTHGTDEAFSDSVRLWCADRGADDPDLFAAEDLVDGCGVPKLRTDTESEANLQVEPNLASHGCAIERLVVDLSNPQLAPRLLELRLTLDRARRGGAGEAPSLFDLVGRARDL